MSDPGPYRSYRSYLGVSVPRREDDRLLRGRRVSVADLRIAGTVDVAFVRSPVPHGTLRSVDVAAARSVEGVAGAWSAADLELPFVPPFGGRDTGRPWPPLARDRLRYVGQQLAAVAGEDRYAAEDGCDAVRYEIDPLPTVVDPRAALAADAPLVWDQGNLLAEQHIGDPVEDVLATAPVVVEAGYRQEFVQHTSMEARAILVRPDDDGGLTVWVSHQGQHILRDAFAAAFRLETRLIRVIVPDVGGAFGGKSGTWSEYLAVAGIARDLNRPARWIEDRHEALLCGPRGRGQWQTVRLAADRDGRLRALDLDIVGDVGGYPASGAMVPAMSALVACGCYALDRAHVRVRSVTTTTAPTSPYRGAGRPEGAYQLERTMDLLARRLGIDAAELRRRNFVRPDQFPHATPTGALYDSGDYPRAFDVLLDRLDYAGARSEQRRRRAAGERPLGVGLCCYVERAGAAAHSPEYGAIEVSASGQITATSGSTSTGQGHETVFPQIVADVLQVPIDTVRLVARDTRVVREGHGSFGSRSLQVGGGALWRAGESLIRLACERAAALLDVDVTYTRYAHGRVGAGERTVSLADLAERTGPLRSEDVFTPPQAFPFGCYGAVVELDPATGTVHLLRLAAVDDYGVVVNPRIVEGQTVGSIVQGIGQALYENAGYLPDGAPQARTLLDYHIPTIAEVPELRIAETSTPNPNQPFGAKGAGEAGCIGAPPAILNAIADALELNRPDLVQLPATPDQIWRLAQTRVATSLSRPSRPG